MCVVQKINDNNKTFTQLTETTMALVIHEGSQSHTIDVVFDVYRDTSIKDAERCNWGSTTYIQYKNIARDHHIQQWRKFLCNPCNKSSLIQFIVEEWKQPAYRASYRKSHWM